LSFAVAAQNASSRALSRRSFLRMAIEGELERREQEARRTVALRNVAGWIG